MAFIAFFYHSKGCLSETSSFSQSPWSKVKSQLDRNISKNEEKVDFKRRRGADFRLGFRWPTFHYLDQTTRQDQWGREKKNSVGLPKPAFFFQSKFKDDHT